MSQRLSESGSGAGGAAPFDPSKAQQLPPARTTPNIFQRLQLGKPKSRRTLRSASSSTVSRSIGEEEEEEKKKQGTTASSTTTTGTSSSSSSSSTTTNNAWVGIGSSGTGTTRRASGSTGASTLGHSMSLGMSSSSSTMMGPSPRLSSNSNAVPGHLKMKTRPTPLPPPPPPPSSSSSPADEAPIYGHGDGDPTPSRPRPSHQAMLGGTVSKLNAHLSPTRRSSRGGEGGGELQASSSGAGSGLETGILSIDLTSDDEAAEDRQQQQRRKQQQQQQRSKSSGHGLQQEDVGGSLSSDEDSSASTHQQHHKSGSSSSSSSSSKSKSKGTGAAGRRRGLGDILGKLGGGGGGIGGRGGSRSQSHHPSTAAAAAAAAAAATAKSYTERKFEELMAAEVVDLNKLREQSWGGIPDRYRGTIWRLLLGYLPANRDRREATLTRKRREYAEILPLYFNIAPEERTMQEQEILRQILVDLPRTQPEMPLFHQEETQRCMERVLYVWAIRHPASGYVQGMNDLITPLILVFLAERLMHPPTLSPSPSYPSSSYSYSSEHLHDSPSAQPSYLSSSISTSSSSSYSSPLSPHSSSASSSPRRSGRTASGAAAAEAQALDVSKVPREILEQVEADVYWCITKLLDNIQDHYTFSQPGLQRMIFRLQALVERHDPSLHRHLEEEGLQYVQFAFRWMNCLLMRELSLDAIIRIWDTELAEETGGFEAFHVYLCAAFLLRFADHLRTLPFQDLVLFLQDLPTHDWTLHEIEPLLSQAHVLRALYPEFGQPGGARVLPPGRGGGGRGER